MSNRSRSILLLFPALLLIASCQSSAPRKEAPKPTALSHTLSEKIYLVFQALEIQKLTFDKDGNLDFTVSKSHPEEVPTWGSASVITEDGYFLTAKHIFRNPELPVWVIGVHGKKPYYVPARIVKVSDKSDWALLHCDLETPNHFTWSHRGEKAPSGTKVYQGVAQSFLDEGRVVWSPKLDSSRRKTRHVYSHLVSRSGDSGGPIVDEKGRLVAINQSYFGINSLNAAISRAVRPNVDYIETLIEDDRVLRQPIKEKPE